MVWGQALPPHTAVTGPEGKRENRGWVWRSRWAGLRDRAKSEGVRQQGRKGIDTVGQSELYNGPHASSKGVQGAGGRVGGGVTNPYSGRSGGRVVSSVGWSHPYGFPIGRTYSSLMGPLPPTTFRKSEPPLSQQSIKAHPHILFFIFFTK